MSLILHSETPAPDRAIMHVGGRPGRHDIR